MAIPVYLWLKDDGGADIKGSVDVQDREGSIEVISMGHGVNLPVDTANGKITGTTAAKLCGMPLSTFRYRVEIYEKAKLL